MVIFVLTMIGIALCLPITMSFLYLVLGKHTKVQWSTGLRPAVYCKHCNVAIHGCFHWKGVLSTWEHINGEVHCADGVHVATHR